MKHMPLVRLSCGIIDVGQVNTSVYDKLPETMDETYNKKLTTRIITDNKRCDDAIRYIMKNICCVQDASGRKINFVGFDTESENHKLALIQIACSGGITFLFRHYVFSNKKLIEFLLNQDIMKIGIGVTSDIRSMKNMLGSQNAYPFFNLETVLSVKYPNLNRLGLQNVTASLLNKKLCKKQQCAEWLRKKRYSQEMIDYAARDAYVSIDLIFKCFTDGIGTPSTDVVNLDCCGKNYVTLFTLRTHMKSKHGSY